MTEHGAAEPQAQTVGHVHFCKDCSKEWQHLFPFCAAQGDRDLLCPTCFVQRTYVPVARFCIEEAENEWRRTNGIGQST